MSSEVLKLQGLDTKRAKQQLERQFREEHPDDETAPKGGEARE